MAPPFSTGRQKEQKVEESLELAHKNKLIKQLYANLAGKPMIGFCCRKNFRHHGWYYPIICTYQR
jgi:hypothetical protein